MTEVVPEFVGYTNGVVEKLGERLERVLKDAINEMATKADLALVEERAQNDRKELADLRAAIKADKDAAAARGRRIWTAIWGMFGSLFVGLVVAFAPSIFTLLTTHH